MNARSPWLAVFGTILVVVTAFYGGWALWFAKPAGPSPSTVPLVAPVNGRAT
ncbi:MAG: hypothetical protein KBG15_01635 [Kofleriaceae bacterium]|nr:hypothetical protein [Kofleriaceae bacterium]